MRFKRFPETDVKRTVRDSWGDNAYLFWVEDCYFPTLYYVRGDSFQDAMDWFVEDDRVLKDIKCDPIDLDIDSDMSDTDIENHLEELRNNGVISWNDSGVMYWSETIHGCCIHQTNWKD